MSTETASSGGSGTTPGLNWARNLRYSARTLHRPTSLDELRRVVTTARHVRALGTRHCFNDVADSPGDLVTLEGLPTEVDVDSAAGTARVSGATSYGVLAQELHAHGAALATMASLPHISVAGAVATATHGSGDRARNLAAVVRAVELVGADGELRRVERGEEDFAGSVVALGALGVVTHVELDVLPTYDVRQDVYSGLSFDALVENLDAVTSAAHSVSVFTDWTGPDTSQVWLKTRLADSADAPAELFGARPCTEPLNPVPEADVRNATQQLGMPGPWHERLPHFRFSFTPSKGEELQAEYLLPREHALEAIGALRELGPRIAPLLHVSEIRTVAADELWLSGSCGRDTVAVHFTFAQRQPEVLALLADVEAALDGLDARPHWGKLFTTPAQRLEALYPRFADFRALVARHDPGRRFANAFTDRVGVTG
ncbi:xylitol oxidase [Kineococcus xinjiangensis]|uniref:Xylitol oxidase n=1 Tax=Kineococcus xinjiangensis TaxID=512762 RepID=A0A2S6II61_9ACTN|nr:D-arabinono-1,4-lactone oxidase [Kineococcus xinjiangensis]PPK93912.1 xylitol oxidase [Kineococcus xinjiangensis]